MPRGKKGGGGTGAKKCTGAVCVHFHTKYKGQKRCKVPDSQTCVHFHPKKGRKKGGKGRGRGRKHPKSMKRSGKGGKCTSGRAPGGRGRGRGSDSDSDSGKGKGRGRGRGRGRGSKEKEGITKGEQRELMKKYRLP